MAEWQNAILMNTLHFYLITMSYLLQFDLTLCFPHILCLSLGLRVNDPTSLNDCVITMKQSHFILNAKSKLHEDIARRPSKNVRISQFFIFFSVFIHNCIHSFVLFRLAWNAVNSIHLFIYLFSHSFILSRDSPGFRKKVSKICSPATSLG